MQVEDLEVILKVAEFRSITAAAESLDMRVAIASAAIKRVEKQLGAELFIRTTRQLRLSAAGERYIPSCQEAVAMLAQAHQHVKEELAVIDGELRLALSSDLGRNIVVPWLDEFLTMHPSVKLKINLSDSNIDFYRDAVDIALRYGSPTDSNLYGFKICDVPGLLCATEEYLSEFGAPKHPQELVRHNGLFYQLYDVIHDVWTFSKDGESFKIKMHGNRASNDGDLVRRWCVSGKGLAVKSSLDMSNDLVDKRVVPVMNDYQARKTELWLVCPSRQSITPAVRLLRDFIKMKCHDVFEQLINGGILPK